MADLPPHPQSHKAIPIKNLYYMLAYAFRELNQGDYRRLQTEEFDHLHDLLAAILATGVSTYIRQGLSRDYRTISADLPTVRGQIMLGQTMRHQVSRRRRLHCQYDELTADTPSNQVLKTVMVLLIASPQVRRDRRNVLRSCLSHFPHVRTTTLRDIDWPRLIDRQRSSSQAMLLGVCRLVARGMLLSSTVGSQQLATFFDDQALHALYESFLRGFYTCEYPHLRVRASQIEWDVDHTGTDKTGTGEEGLQLPRMQTDITIEGEGKCLIIDAKLYREITKNRFNSQTARSAHLYQIFTYVVNKAASMRSTSHMGQTDRDVSPADVGGVILYAQPASASNVSSQWNIGGHPIGVQSLDLNQEFSAIADNLRALADQHFELNSEPADPA